MYCRAPVIAVNNGGPTESIVHGVTGYLCNPDKESFGNAIGEVVGVEGGEMGKRGRERVVELFSLGTFERELGGVVDELAKGGRGKRVWWGVAVVGALCCFGILLL